MLLEIRKSTEQKVTAVLTPMTEVERREALLEDVNQEALAQLTKNPLATNSELAALDGRLAQAEDGVKSHCCLSQ